MKIVESLVAFIDLLGFSERVLALSSVGDLGRLIDSIRRIRSYFDYQPADPGTREAQRISNTEVLAFSDCVVVSIGLKSPATEVQGEFDVSGHDLLMIAHVHATAVASGNFLRGGLDKGLWHHDPAGILVSPALVQAYRLEQQAKYPILTISDSLYKFLRDHPGRQFYSKDFDPFPRMFRVSKDKSGKRIRYLKYIELAVNDLDWQYDRKTIRAYRAANPDDRDAIARKGYKRNVESFFRYHKKAIESAYKELSSSRIKSKYAFLANYHNEIVDKYFGTRDDLKVRFTETRHARRRRRSRFTTNKHGIISR